MGLSPQGLGIFADAGQFLNQSVDVLCPAETGDDSRDVLLFKNRNPVDDHLLLLDHHFLVVFPLSGFEHFKHPCFRK